MDSSGPDTDLHRNNSAPGNLLLLSVRMVRDDVGRECTILLAVGGSKDAARAKELINNCQYRLSFAHILVTCLDCVGFRHILLLLHVVRQRPPGNVDTLPSIIKEV